MSLGVGTPLKHDEVMRCNCVVSVVPVESIEIHLHCAIPFDHFLQKETFTTPVLLVIACLRKHKYIFS